MKTNRTASLIPVFLGLIAAAWGQAPPAVPATQLEAVVTTELGTFRFEFAPDKAPNHVTQFIERAKKGYYDGSAFHRVVPNGLIQGGDPGLKNPDTPRSAWGKGGRDIKMPTELSNMKHVRGVVSTVRSYDLDTDNPQFFVCLSDQTPLDGGFTAFGRVTEGIEIVEQISRIPSDEHNQPVKPVRILSVTIESKKKH